MKAVFASLALLVCSGLASANITASGTGKVVFVPDVGYVSVGVSSDGTTAAEAWQKNGEVVRRVFDALKAIGLEDKDLKTSNLHVSPRYDRPKDKAPVLVGYTAGYDLNVTVHDLKLMGKVLDAAVEAGANRQMAISFGCSDPEKLMDEARRRAVAEARKKAEIYVNGAGASLGLVQNITEGSFTPYRSLQYEQMAPAGAKADLVIAAGEQEMSVTVTVTYTLNHGAGSPKS
jgi:uncharacterized protein YggE